METTELGRTMPTECPLKKKKVILGVEEYQISVVWAPKDEGGQKPRPLGGRSGSWPTGDCRISQEGVW